MSDLVLILAAIFVFVPVVSELAPGGVESFRCRGAGCRECVPPVPCDAALARTDTSLPRAVGKARG